MSGLQVYQAGGQGVVTAQFPPVQSPRSPTTSDIVGSDGSPYNLLRQWINTVTLTSYVYYGGGNWVLNSSSTGTLFTLTDTSGTPVTPAAGNIQLAGTANQITVTAGTNKLTFSLPSTLIAPGSIASTTTITAGTGITATTGNIAASAGAVSASTTVTAGTGVTATTGNLTATNGNLVLSAAGNKLVIHATTAANDSVGTTAAMSGSPGTVTVSTTACTTSSKILFARATTGGTPGEVSISAQSAGSFTLLSTGNETSTFNYLIIN